MARLLAILLACVVLTACQPAPPQPTSGSLDGIIEAIDEQDIDGRKPLGAATVSLAGTDRSARTDSQGRFRFDNIASGQVELIVEASGYETFTLTRLDVRAGEVASAGRIPLRPLETGPKKVSLTAGVLFSDLPEGITGETIPILIEAVQDDLTTSTSIHGEGAFQFEEMHPGPVQLTLSALVDGADFVRTYDVTIGDQDTTIESPFILTPVPIEAELNGASSVPGDVTLLSAGPGLEGIFGEVMLDGPQEAGRWAFGGATIAVTGPEARTAEVGLDGRFQLVPLKPGEYTVRLGGPALRVAGAYQALIVQVPSEAVAYIRIPARLPEVNSTTSGAASAPVPTTPAAPEAPGSLTLTGTLILSSKSGAMPMAFVTLAGTQFTATPGVDGGFSIRGVPPGRYSLVAAAQDHKPYGPESLDLSDAKNTVDLGEITLELDLQRPKVLSTDPTQGRRNLAVDEVVPFTIVFDQPMNPGTVKQALSISPTVTMALFMGRESQRSDDRTLYGELYGAGVGNPLDHDTSYRVTIASSAANMQGVSMGQPYTLSFSTSKPSIIDTFPKDGSTGNLVSVNDALLIYCNAPIDDRLTTERVVSIRPDNGGSDPLLRVTKDARTGWGILEVRYPFETNTQYRVRIGSRLRTASGRSFDNAPYTFSFRTGEVATQTLDEVSSGGRRERRRGEAPRREED